MRSLQRSSRLMDVSRLPALTFFTQFSASALYKLRAMRDMSLRNVLPLVAELLNVNPVVVCTAVLLLTMDFCLALFLASLADRLTEFSAGFS